MANNSHAHRFVNELTSTMKIDPDAFSPKTSTSRLDSLSYALAGWLYMLRRQKNTRIQAVATVLVAALALWLEIDFTGLALLVLVVAMVWMAEFINAAVEAAINISAPQVHPMAKVGKDVASAAVLLGAVAAVLVGLLIMGPPLLARLAG
ncbi:MAG: diacylglycerol kinase family protein [Aggregatilineales bacterium]